MTTQKFYIKKRDLRKDNLGYRNLKCLYLYSSNKFNKVSNYYIEIDISKIAKSNSLVSNENI